MQQQINPPALNHPDAYQRAARLEAICREAEPETAASAAALLLSDADPSVRECAARLLIERGDEAAARHTAPLVASRSITVRNMAGEILARLGEPAVKALTPMLNHPDKDVRKFVLDVLAELPAEIAAGSISLRLYDEDLNVVLAAIDALGNTGNASFAPELRAVYDREPLARPFVLEALGNYALRDDLPLFENALSDANPVVQLAAAEAISRLDAPEVLPLLSRKIGEVHPMAQPVLIKSIVSLCHMQHDLAARLTPEFRDACIAVLDDPESEFKMSAVEGLHWFLDDDVVEKLLSHTATSEALDTTIFEVIREYPDASSRVIQAADNGRMPASIAATYVLALLAQQVPEDHDWEPLTHFLQAYYSELEADTKLAAIDISIRMRNPGLFRILRTALTDPDPTVCSFATDAAIDVGLITEQDMLEFNPRYEP